MTEQDFMKEMARALEWFTDRTCPSCHAETLGLPQYTGMDENDSSFNWWSACTQCRIEVHRSFFKPEADGIGNYQGVPYDRRPEDWTFENAKVETVTRI